MISAALSCFVLSDISHRVLCCQIYLIVFRALRYISSCFMLSDISHRVSCCQIYLIVFRALIYITSLVEILISISLSCLGLDYLNLSRYRYLLSR